MHGAHISEGEVSAPHDGADSRARSRHRLLFLDGRHRFFRFRLLVKNSAAPRLNTSTTVLRAQSIKI